MSPYLTTKAIENLDKNDILLQIRDRNCREYLWSPMNPKMFWEVLFLFESGVWLHWNGLSPVCVLMYCCKWLDLVQALVALVTFKRLFSCMLPHLVNFQISSYDAQIPAHCAAVWLCMRVSLLMQLQVAWICCCILTLIAMIKLFLSVLLNVCFEVGRLVTWKVAMCALEGFLPTVNEGMGLQVIIPTKRLTALQTVVLLEPIALCSKSNGSYICQ